MAQLYRTGVTIWSDQAPLSPLATLEPNTPLALADHIVTAHNAWELVAEALSRRGGLDGRPVDSRRLAAMAYERPDVFAAALQVIHTDETA